MANTISSDDPRLGDLIQQGIGGACTLLGFPHDEGVRRNGGRPGAAEAPEVVRKYLQRVGTLKNPELNIDLRELAVFDAGNIAGDVPLEDAHALLRNRVLEILNAGSIPFVVGGGNDESFPNAMGLVQHVLDKQPGKSVGVVNIDAHLDVRPHKNGKVHSGSPFRDLLLNADFQRTHAPTHAHAREQEHAHFVEFAAQGSQCSAEHADFVKQHGGRILWLSDLKGELHSGVLPRFESCLDTLGDKIFVSFDLDAVQSSDAPGVSCASPLGLTAHEALQIAFSAGKNKKVALFDISEYNPKIEEYRTGRLVSFMFYYFLLGLARREL